MSDQINYFVNLILKIFCQPSREYCSVYNFIVRALKDMLNIEIILYKLRTPAENVFGNRLQNHCSNSELSRMCEIDFVVPW